MHVIIDTNVLVSGLRSHAGASNAILALVSQGAITPVASVALWLEYEDVLKRPDICALHGLNAREVDQFLSALVFWIEPVHLHYVWRPQLKDAGDEMVLEAAVNAHVDALVTHNVRDFQVAAPRFGLNVITPAQLLSILEHL